MLKLLLCAFAFMLIQLNASPPAHGQSLCEPRSPAEQVHQATAVIDATVIEIIPGEVGAQVRLAIDRVFKDDRGLLTPGGALALETSLPGEIVVGEIPFNDGWPYWRLYLHPLEPGSATLITNLCHGSVPLPDTTK